MPQKPAHSDLELGILVTPGMYFIPFTSSKQRVRLQTGLHSTNTILAPDESPKTKSPRDLEQALSPLTDEDNSHRDCEGLFYMILNVLVGSMFITFFVGGVVILFTTASGPS